MSRHGSRAHEATPHEEAHTGPDSPPLIETKLHAPRPRSTLVPRPRLVDRASAGDPRKLTLLAAPAGSGKTTVLSDWLVAQSAERTFAWLSLDAQDNDPVRFWTYVIEALRRMSPDVGRSSIGLLRARRIGISELALPALLNELNSVHRPLTLILDDYHVIHSGEIHAQLAFLLDMLPSRIEVAVATRVDPPLPLARLRVRGELLEIRAGDLRFTEDEAAAFLNGALGLGLSSADVAELQRHTEGWAAGLYLAALSLTGRSDVSAFIAGFAGDDRHVVDYLGAESLIGLSGETREFLLATSILERLCGSLCDAVVGREDSAQLLSEIEGSNLFLIPLDSKREWYRYHHLFAEVLRHELRISHPGRIEGLHLRAAQWYGAHDMVPDRIHHAVMGGDVAGAAVSIAEHWNAYFNRGELATVSGWLDGIPDEAVRGDPQLCVSRAWLHMDTGSLEEAERWMDASEHALQTDRAPATRTSLVSDTAMLRAVHRFKIGSVDDAPKAAKTALEIGGAETLFPRTVAQCILGITEYWRGLPEQARAALEGATKLARTSQNDLAANYALGYLAILASERGALDEAAGLVARAAGVSEEPGITEHFVGMMTRLASGEVLAQRGRLGAANDEVLVSVKLARRGAGRLEWIRALVGLARIRHATRDRDGAVEAVREARAILFECPDPGIARELVGQAERELRLPRARPTQAGAEPAEALTDRELAVLRLLPGGLSLEEIAKALFISRNTVKTHAQGVYRKLGASSRAEAVAAARGMGLLGPAGS